MVLNQKNEELHRKRNETDPSVSEAHTSEPTTARNQADGQQERDKACVIVFHVI